MTDINQLLQQLAGQLRQEGKTPSLALFRARLAGKVTPQQLFAAYQQWRNNPQYSEPQDNLTPPKDVAVRLVQADTIQQQLDRIEAKLDLLLSKLELS